MHKVLISTLLLFIISFIRCDEDLVEELRRNQFEYYLLENNINHKICDESTFSGVLNYDEEFLNRIDECEHLQDVKLQKNSYIRRLCKKEVFFNQNRNQVLYNTRCNRTEINYTYCVSNYEDNLTKYTETNSSTDKIITVEHLEEFFKKKDNIINCFKKALNTDIAVNDTENFFGEYAFVRYRLVFDLRRIEYLLIYTSHRNVTFSKQTQDKQFADFIKCHDLLSADCSAKFNSSNVLKFETHYKKNSNFGFKQFTTSQMQDIPNIVKICQPEKYTTIKIKDYYEKEGKNLQSLIDCQKYALNLSEKEKLSFLSEERMKELFKLSYCMPEQ